MQLRNRNSGRDSGQPYLKGLRIRTIERRGFGIDRERVVGIQDTEELHPGAAASVLCSGWVLGCDLFVNMGEKMR